jgi:CubicO group peptidase (beta-lactamase class C family)
VSRAFALVDAWPVEHAAAGFIDSWGNTHMHGDVSRRYRLASVSKFITAWATLIAVEEGSISLEDPVGHDECTVRHLLAHAGGYGFDTKSPIISVARKRVYSNTGFDLLADHIAEFVDMEFSRYVHEAVFEPLGMNSAVLDGSAAKDMSCTAGDLALFAAEIRDPRLVSRETHVAAITAQFPDLDGVVPGIGAFSPCPWGLGAELHGSKHPHWMPQRASASTYGHFGGSGTFVWVDPVANVACFALTARTFGDWAMEAWPVFGEAVLIEGRP